METRLHPLPLSVKWVRKVRVDFGLLLCFSDRSAYTSTSDFGFLLLKPIRNYTTDTHSRYLLLFHFSKGHKVPLGLETLFCAFQPISEALYKNKGRISDESPQSFWFLLRCRHHNKPQGKFKRNSWLAFIFTPRAHTVQRGIQGQREYRYQVKESVLLPALV